MRVLALALAAVAVAAVSGSVTPSGARLSFVVNLDAGVVSGTVVSPGALCEANGDGALRTRISDRLGSFEKPAWRADGGALAFGAYDPVARSHVVRVTPAGTWRPSTVARGRDPAWSPDGRTLAYAAGDGLYVVPAAGGTAECIADGAVESPSWAPDGRVVFGRTGGATTGVWIVAPSGERRVTSDGGTPAFSPDGSRIAFVLTTPAGGAVTRSELFTVRADGSAREQISQASTRFNPPVGITLSRPAWSPDGRTIAVVRTVTFHNVKGPYVTGVDLLLVRADGGGQTVHPLPKLTRDPAWRRSAPLTASAVSRRPCLIRGNGTLAGRAFDDLIVGGDKAQRIDGRGGNDWIHARGGNDRITGGPGRDEIWSGYGADRVLVRDGTRDIVRCGDLRRDTVVADARDVAVGRCRLQRP